eukprot:gene1297-273_t
MAEEVPDPGANEAPEKEVNVIRNPELEAEPEEAVWLVLGEDYPLDENMTELHHQCARIKKIENLDRCPKLKKFVLIANGVERMENFENTPDLEHLEIYQNVVMKIRNISHLHKLKVLDLSFNEIRQVQNIDAANNPLLEKLYLSSNKIKSMDGLKGTFEHLEMVEFGANRIREITGLEGCPNLKELYLGKNKIISMALPCPLPKLQKLSMQSCRLQNWDLGIFDAAPCLSHLYLGHNGLPNPPKEIEKLQFLVELDLAANPIDEWPSVSLPRLADLWLNDADFADIEKIEKISRLKGLTTIYLERCPWHKAVGQRVYRQTIEGWLPNLKWLDSINLDEGMEPLPNMSLSAQQCVTSILKNKLGKEAYDQWEYRNAGAKGSSDGRSDPPSWKGKISGYPAK